MSTFTVYQRVPNDLFEDSSPHPCAPLPLFTSLLISLCLCLFIHLLISLVVSLSISLPYLFPCLFRYWFPYVFPYFPRIPWTLATRATRMRVASTPPPLVCILPPGPSRLLISKIMDTVPSASIQKKKDLVCRRGSRRRQRGRWRMFKCLPPKKMRLTWGLIQYTADFWTGIHVFYPAPIISILKVLSISAHPQLANQGTKDKFYSPRCHWSPFQAQRGPSPRSSGHPQCSLTSTRRKTTRNHEMFIDVWRV